MHDAAPEAAPERPAPDRPAADPGSFEIPMPPTPAREGEPGGMLLSSSRRVLVALRLILCGAFVAAMVLGRSRHFAELPLFWRYLAAGLLLALMLSNIALLCEPVQRFFERGRCGWLLFGDVLIVGALMVLLGEHSQTFLMIAFVTVFVAAIARNIVYAAPIAIMTGALYFAFAVLPALRPAAAPAAPVELQGFDLPALTIFATRLIFLFSMALFVTYLAQAAQRLRAQTEALVSWRKAIFQRVVEQEKMASLGQLAAGLAHEINNPVGFIRSNLSTLKEYAAEIRRLLVKYRELRQAAADGPPERCAALAAEVQALEQELSADFMVADLEKIVAQSQDGAERLRRIVLDLRSFSHADKAELVPADVNALLDSALNIVWNEIKYRAEVRKQYGAPPPIEAYGNQLVQVFINLLVNAAQAISERGTITLRTRAVGDEVEVRISDTGCGIPPQHLSKIFLPFFTTKPVGEGSGLGLSVAWGIIVERHRGRIEVESAVGKGTTFIIRLPAGPLRTGATSMALRVVHREDPPPAGLPAGAAAPRPAEGEPAAAPVVRVLRPPAVPAGTEESR